MPDQTDRNFELPGDPSQYSETELTEYVNDLVRELADTRSQQLRLGKRVDQLSGTVAGLARTLGSLTHNHDQLDAKVRSMVADVGRAKADSRKAVETADEAIREVGHLREETRRQFQRVNDNLASLGSRIDRFIADV